MDESKVDEFVGRALTDFSGAAATVMAYMGDQLGLFKDLAANGPGTSVEVAARTGLNERYVREWLGGMSSAAFIDYEPTSGMFALPDEHVPVLADEAGPKFFGGALEAFVGGMMSAVPGVLKAFEHGGGVHQSEYPDQLWNGLERFSAGWFNNMLIPVWLPAMPDVISKLEAGCRVADVGCGRGRALIALAEAYPGSSYVGYEVFEPTVELARSRAEAAGVADRVQVEHADVSQGLPEEYDIITTFDVVHDAVDPLGLLKSIRSSLSPSGHYVCLDINCSDKIEENLGPLATYFHGASLTYCMTSSLANNGAGLGTLGFHERKVQEMCREVGFTDVQLVEIENPFNNLYLATR